MKAVSLTAAIARRASVPPGWTRALWALGVLLALVLVLYRDAALGMLEIWYRSDTFAHCFLILPISLWLVWRRRVELACMRPASQPWMLLPVAVAGFAWLLGELATVNALTHFALVALVVFCVVAVVGAKVARRIAFPLAFLFLMVPFGEFVMPQMMAWTADFTVFALAASGIPVYREGLQFVIPSGSWSVVEACSGVRYLIASFTVGTLYAYLTYRSTAKRLAFVLVSLIVPVVANWLRAYMIVMLGHLSGNRIAVGVDHLIYGWVFFGIVIMAMFAVGARWGEDEAPAMPAAAPPAGDTRPPQPDGILWLAAGAAALVLTLPPLANALILRSEAATPVRMVLPVELAGWRQAPSLPIGWRPEFEAPTAETQVSYASEGRVVGVFVAYYRNQRAGHTLVNSENAMARPRNPRWSQVVGGDEILRLGGMDRQFRSAELLGVSGAGRSVEGRLLAWQIYWVDGTWTANDAVAKLFSGLSRMRGHGDDSAVLIVYGAKERPATRESVRAFLREAGPGLEAALAATRIAR